MTALFSAEEDCFARLTVTYAPHDSIPAARFFYFKSHARRAELLYQVFPGDAQGYAFLRRAEQYIAFNPAGHCFRDTGTADAETRFGVTFIDLNPVHLAQRKVTGGVMAGRLQDKPVFILELEASGTAARERLYLSRDSLLPLRVERVSDSGNMIRTVDYLSYFRVGQFHLPRRMLIETHPGVSLLVEADQLSCRSLPDVVFTLAYLEELNR
jgi:hypothetical protein